MSAAAARGLASWLALLPAGPDGGRRLVLALVLAPLVLAVPLHALTAPELLPADLGALAALLAAGRMRAPGAGRPALPRLRLAAGLTGVGIALAALGPLGLPAALGLGLLAVPLHLAAFGTDPAVPATRPREAAPLAQAESRLAEIAARLAPLQDAEIAAAHARFATAARRLIAALEHHPVALTGSRRHLGPLLDGTLDAARRLAQVWRTAEHGAARAEFLAFLADLAQAYAAEAARQEREIRTAMELEIAVVRDQINAGGNPQDRKGQGQ